MPFRARAFERRDRMKGEARKAAVSAYKERKVVAGIFAVRCQATGQVWVGHAPNVETIQTRQWFTLRQGAHPRQDLLEAWRTHGEEQFTFEVLERIADDAPSSHPSLLKNLAESWREKLQANPV